MENIIITGANRGIGFEMAKRFLNEGKHVFATYRDAKQAEELISFHSHGTLTALELDVDDPTSIDRFVAAIGDTRIDVLINNAGILGPENQSIHKMDREAWLTTFSVNTIAPFMLTTALLDNLKRSDNPRVVSISSQMGALSRNSTGSYAYRSSKAALNKVMQVLAHELESEGIIVCPVHPGWVRTDMGGELGEISVQESATGLVSLITQLSKEHSGRFWTWEGEEHLW